GGAATAAPSPTAVTRATPVVLLDLRRRPAEAGTDLVGDDLDDGPLFAVVGLPRALLEAAGDEEACALLDGLTHVLAHVAPAHDVEERRGFLPLLGLAVLPAPIHGDPEVGLGLAAGGEPQLGIAGDVAHHGDVVAVCHLYAPFASALAVGVAALGAAAATSSGKRITLWRSTSSARKRARSSSDMTEG